MAFCSAGSMLDAGRGRVGAGVGLMVGVERLHRRLGGADAGLGVGVLRLLALVEERGKRDRGEDADDQDDDQELDEREALLVLRAEHEACGAWSCIEPSLSA